MLPQLLVSFMRFISHPFSQLPSRLWYPVLHAHPPPEHPAFAPHIDGVHAAPQTPDLHTWPVAHLFQSLPQWFVLFMRFISQPFVQLPSRFAYPALHAHAVPEHAAFAPHMPA
jgi:hypothetical protein